MPELEQEQERISVSFMLDYIPIGAITSMSNHRQDEKYAKIINTSREVFSTLGYKGTTVERIAKSAGISKGSIYLYFETKEDILSAIIDSCVQDMIERVEVELSSEGTPEERLYRAIYAAIMSRRHYSLMDKLSQEAREFGTPAPKHALDQMDEATMRSVMTLLQKAVEQQLVQIDDIRLTAFVLGHLYHSLTTEWERYYEPLSDEQIFNTIRRFLV